MEKYSVTYSIHGRSFNREDNGKEMTLIFTVSVSFSHNPDTYGNGYSMGIEGDGEPFGLTVYDIRYDGDFDPENKMEYIMRFYANKYSGKNGSWKLKKLFIEEDDE